MMKQLLKRSILIIFIPATLLLIAACANMANPGGGPYDLDPPKVVSVSPEFNATNVKNGRFEFEFDENVVIERPSEKVIVTPPQQRTPVIRSVNRKVRVELKDTLLPNTTYTIDFTDALRDNNEANIFENFAYSFSTGDVVDTMAISGRVVDAQNMEPMKGIFVGLHSNLNDTAFTKIKFERIAKTNDKGEFTVRGVSAGKYRVFALDDISRKYMYSNMASPVAFWDSVVEPSSMPAVRQDSVFKSDKKTGFKIFDTIVDVNYTRFMPDNLVLRLFVSDARRKYLQSYERKDNRLMIYFGAPTEMPVLEPMSFDVDKKDWYDLEKYPKNDTLTYWIKDKSLLEMDTLVFKMSYLKTDSLNQDHWVTDTLKFAERGRKKVEKKKKDDKEEESIVFMNMNSNLKNAWDIFADIQFEFSEPLVTNFADKIKLEKLQDTVYTEVEGFNIVIDSINPRKFRLNHQWNYGEEYQLSIDSASVFGLSGLWNNGFKQAFKIKSKKEYGEIRMALPGIGNNPAFVELLDKSDKPLRQLRVKGEVVVFRNVVPGEYYMRLIVDNNENNKWDTGDYFKQQQPEVVLYFAKKLTVRANWDLEDVWNIDLSNPDYTKPLDITKNKPESRKNKQKELEDRDRKKEEEKKRIREEGKQLGGNSEYGNYGFDEYNNSNY